MRIMVTGGAGFIGSAVVRMLLKHSNDDVLNLDKLTYAGNLDSIKEVAEDKRFANRYQFSQLDICDEEKIYSTLCDFKPDAIMHLAAESHVDRSIDGPKEFINTNIMGTFSLLQATRRYWQTIGVLEKEKFRFHHISTDEVFGSLPAEGYFREDSPYQPNSPYSASKASSDHLVRAWGETFGLPILITNCSNNYGPFQFPEKLIPLMILNGLGGKPLPVYGNGSNVRDWLYVEDHAAALILALKKAKAGETYNIGGNSEMQNIDIVKSICRILDELSPNQKIGRRESLITFVKDRPGHDQRYAIDASKIKKNLGFSPSENLESGLKKTVIWYLENPRWIERVLSGKYQLERLGNHES